MGLFRWDFLGGRPMKRVRGILWGLVLVWGVCGWTVEVRYVGAREYFSTARAEIDKARRSVTVCLYLFSLRSNQSQSAVFQLAEALARAHGRGVSVEVLLDAEDLHDAVEGKNRAAYDFLRGRGIPVFFDDTATLTHTKALVIDDATVLMGSSNWSDSAMNNNEEGNLLVRSTDVARDTLRAIRGISRQDPLVPEERGVSLPMAFLANGVLGQMGSRPDERALDTYLYLLHQEQRAGAPTLDTSDLAQWLGIGHMSPSAYRRQIMKTLRKLRDRYGLVQLEEKPLVVKTVLRSSDTIRLPTNYFEKDGWTRDLSLAGKVVWIISLAEVTRSPLRPRWSVGQERLAERHGVSAWFIRQGLVELRRKNLLEVDHSPLPVPGNDRPRSPAIYTPNALYNLAAWEEKRAALAAKYGVDKLKHAQAAAVLVYEDRDLEGIEELMVLETTRGLNAVRRACAILGAKKPDNPKRTMAYLLATARKVQGEY